MKNVKFFSSNISVDEVGNISIPIDIKVKEGEGSVLAYVRLVYCGFILDDIKILRTSNGHLSVVYPHTVINHNGTSKKVSVVFPGVPDLSRQLNEVILDSYREFLRERAA